MDCVEEGVARLEWRLDPTSTFVAGDVGVAPQQVAVAVGSGHAAGLVAVRELMLGRPDLTRRGTDEPGMGSWPMLLVLRRGLGTA